MPRYPCDRRGRLWRLAVPRFGLAGVYAIGLLVEAAGLVLTVSLPSPYAPLVGGLMLGATFMMITAYGLQIGRQLAPESPRRALAFLTAASGSARSSGRLSPAGSRSGPEAMLCRPWSRSSFS